MRSLLTPLAANHIGMTRLESRPSRPTSGVVFYVDVEGHQQEGKVRGGSRRSSAKHHSKILGSYPAAVT